MWWRALGVVVLLLAAGCTDRGAKPPAGDDGQSADTPSDGTSDQSSPPADLGVTPAPQAPPDPGQPPVLAANLTRRMLTEEQISLAPPPGEWVALRFFLSDAILTGGSTYFAFVSSPTAGASPYVALAVFVPSTDPDVPSPPPIIIPLAMPGEPFTTIATVQTNEGEGGGPPNSPIGTPELMVLYGTSQGQASLHFGIVTEEEAADLAAAQAEILGRPLTNIAPDHGGKHGFAGSFIRSAGTDGTRFDVEAGNLEATWEAATEGPAGTVVDRHLRIAGVADLPVPGIAAVLYSEGQAAVTGEWSYDWRVGDQADSDSGSGAMTALPVPSVLANLLGTRPPSTFYTGPVAAGPAHLDVERTFTGKEDLSGAPPEAVQATTGVFVSWGYVGADLAAMYGWTTGSLSSSLAPA